MAMLRTHAWLALAYGCFGEGPEQAATAACAEGFPADCSKVLCCSAAGMKCFQKHEWYASCFEHCTAGSSPDNPDGDEWTCKVLDRAADDDAAADDDDDVSDGEDAPETTAHDGKGELRQLIDKPGVGKLTGDDVLALADGFAEMAFGKGVPTVTGEASSTTMTKAAQRKAGKATEKQEEIAKQATSTTTTREVKAAKKVGKAKMLVEAAKKAGSTTTTAEAKAARKGGTAPAKVEAAKKATSTTTTREAKAAKKVGKANTLAEAAKKASSTTPTNVETTAAKKVGSAPAKAEAAKEAGSTTTTAEAKAARKGGTAPAKVEAAKKAISTTTTMVAKAAKKVWSATAEAEAAKKASITAMTKEAKSTKFHGNASQEMEAATEVSSTTTTAEANAAKKGWSAAAEAQAAKKAGNSTTTTTIPQAKVAKKRGDATAKVDAAKKASSGTTTAAEAKAAQKADGGTATAAEAKDAQKVGGAAAKARATRGASSTTETVESTEASATTTAAATTTTARAAPPNCSACAPKERDVPDVVIPFYERDLCKVGYTVQSMAVHDRHGIFGTIILMWVSTKSTSEYQGAIDKIKDSASGSHEVQVIDFSPQVNSEGAGGWFAQQVFKLKVASMVKSNFYVVMDSKNTLIRDIQPELLFTECNQGKIFGEFEPDKIVEPHATWYEASARVLNVKPPREAGGMWPTSITPMLIHKQTVLEMLSSIGENPSVDTLCNGPLCEMLGMHSIDGTGATEFTMYVLAAKARADMDCDIAIVPPDAANPPAVSLWRCDQDQTDDIVRSCVDIVTGKKKAFMFGAQYNALENLDEDEREKVEGDILHIFERANMHNASVTSTDSLINCIAGDLKDQAGPIFDITPEQEGDAEGASDDDGKQKDKTEGSADEASARSFCCTGAADSGDTCGTCYPGAKAGPEKFCGKSQDNCAQCGESTWCDVDAEAGIVAVMKVQALEPLLVLDRQPLWRWGSVAAAAGLVFGSALLFVRHTAEQRHAQLPDSRALVLHEDLGDEVL